MVAEVYILGRIVDFLSSAPVEEAILELKATQEETERLEYLVQLKQTETINSEEREELREALIAEQIMIAAKANAYGRFNARTPGIYQPPTPKAPCCRLGKQPL